MKFRQHFFAISIACLLQIPCFSLEATAESKASSPSIDSFITFIQKNPAAVEMADLEHPSKKSIKVPNIQGANYFELVAYYQAYLSKLKQWFPEVAFSYNGITTLELFFGRRNLSSFVVGSNPLLLLHTPVLDSQEKIYRSLKVEYQAKVVYGLQVETRLPESVISSAPEQIYDLLYLADINARVFGFTHGQIILPLSRQVATAKVFDYNAPLSWSRHKRYKQDDQVSAPIALTNYGHSSQKQYYLVSNHPDFAVNFLNYDSKEVVLTVFLWGEGFVAAIRKEEAQVPKRLPDFIFQIKILAPQK